MFLFMLLPIRNELGANKGQVVFVQRVDLFKIDLFGHWRFKKLYENLKRWIRW